MGMYINLYRRNGTKFETDYSWQDEKFVGSWEVFRNIMDNGKCVDLTQPMSDLDQYWRPTKFEKCKEFVMSLETNKEVFTELIELLEKEDDLYVSYY